MAGIEINVKINDAEVKTLLTRLSERVEDLTPVMQAIGQIVRTSVMKNFEEGGRPDKWQPLSLKTLFSGRKSKFATKKGKFRKGIEEKLQGRMILIQTGHLKNSINVKATNRSVSIGTNKVYGAIHQLGGKAGRGKKVNIPARPFLAVQTEDWTEIYRVIGDHLLKA